MAGAAATGAAAGGGGGAMGAAAALPLAGVRQIGQTVREPSITLGPRYPQMQVIGFDMLPVYHAAAAVFAGRFVTMPCSTFTIESASATCSPGA